MRKNVHNDQEETTAFKNVNYFILIDQKVYFVNLSEEIMVVDFEQSKPRAEMIHECHENILCLGYSNNELHALTAARNIYTFVGNNVIYRCTLGPMTNLLHVLKEYDFIERVDWRLYSQWVTELEQPVPQGPLQKITVIRTYGNLVFVGTNWGILYVYASPYNGGVLDMYHADPVKFYNFMMRPACPVPCESCDLCRIISIDILEAEDRHMVLVAIPKKMFVLHLIHNMILPASAPMLRNLEPIEICSSPSIEVLSSSDSIQILSSTESIESD